MSAYSHADLAALALRAYLEQTGSARDLEFMIENSSDETVIAIRGTETGLISERGFMDVKRNLRVIPRYTRATGWGHGGFVRGAVAVAKAVRDIVDKGVPVSLTGHSLGGAIAILCSQILHADGFLINQVVTFGCPRIYTLVRPKFPYQITCYRYGGDIVTTIPRTCRHAVDLIAIGPRRRFPLVSDHGMVNYERELRLNACLKKVGDGL